MVCSDDRENQCTMWCYEQVINYNIISPTQPWYHVIIPTQTNKLNITPRWTGGTKLFGNKNDINIKAKFACTPWEKAVGLSWQVHISCLKHKSWGLRVGCNTACTIAPEHQTSKDVKLNSAEHVALLYIVTFNLLLAGM